MERLARDQRVIGKPNLRTGDRRSLGIDLSVMAPVLCAVLGSTIAPSYGATKSAPADATPRPAYTNRLIDSNDPYLLLHAHNPVDWYSWGPEALAKAKRENRPIFVSIGYSTCYWCHVAERTIYSDPAIAKLMNEWFVNVKVDREQRPDVDSVYMLATQLTTSHGGWPNNVFLTPDLKPFFAGSYFPPADDAFGRPGFPTVLKSLHDAWTHRRPDVERQADQIYQAMLQSQQRSNPSMSPLIKPEEWLAQAREALLQNQDRSQGGLSGGPTKFPREPALNLLLADFLKTGDSKVRDTLTKTLDAMAFGGIHDHLGGGFHRYSTEPTWSIPHFEKMLYDNAQLLKIYAEAYQATDIALYRQVAEDVATYLTRQMTAPAGGFYAAEDAEVAGREGASYLWTRRQIESILGKDQAARFLEVYQLIPPPEPSGSTRLPSDRQGVLRVRMPIAETLARVGGKDISQALAALAPARSRLLAARERRPQPARDEKIIVAWNAMTIDALIRAAEILNKPSYTKLAIKAADRVWGSAYDPNRQELKHQIFRERAQTDGYLDDYALLGIALLSLSESTKESVWRDCASQLATAMLRRFFKGDAFVTTVAANELLIPPPDYGDQTGPSGTSAAVELLSRLYATTANPEYRNAAARTIAHLSDDVQSYPTMWPSAIVAVNRYPVLAGPESRPATAPANGGIGVTAPSSAEHVHAAGELRSAGDHEEITVTMIVDKGYHVNANPASFDYLIPTSVSLDGVPGLRVSYPEPTMIKPKFAPEGLKVYEGKVMLKAAAPSGALPRGELPTAELRVQACTDEICLPPATLPLRIERK